MGFWQFVFHPLFGRNFLDLASLAPGTTVRDGENIDTTKAQAYRVFDVAGRSGTATRVQVDGIDVTDETVGTTVANISVENVQEFQLTRSSLDPSTSLTSSGAVNIISKSDGNALHGSWFWDYYNQGMTARPGYSGDNPNPPDNRKRTGGSAGGPFMKDKLFWFVDFDKTWETQLMRSQNVLFPQLNVNQNSPLSIRSDDARLDWNIKSNMHFFYKFHNDDNLANGGSAVSPFQNIDWTNTHTFAFDVTQGKMTHTIRLGYVRFHNQISSQELDFKYLRTPNGIPFDMNVGAYSSGPNTLAPQAIYQENRQASYEGSWLYRKHFIRYGFDFRRIVLGSFANFAGPLTINGTYDASTVAAIKARGGNVQDPLEYPFESMSVGPAHGYSTLSAAHGLPHGGHYNKRFAYFVQDSWKVTRRFTMNLGVRWQYDTQYFADPAVPRDPILERWGKGYSKLDTMPKNLYSPSFGFAWDVTGAGKTVIRGGFYKAYEMNIQNNTMFDEFSMLPPGIGPDLYTEAGVTGPDGTPLNADGKHPNGDYSDLIGQPVKNVYAIFGQLQTLLNAAYDNYKFDPNKGPSTFVITRGVTYGGQIPGDWRIPYSLQFNLGIQRELKPGTVLTVDWIYNHGIGLPIFLTDKQRRRDAATLNIAAAQSKINSVLAGKTVDQWIAANPTNNISAFGLVNDTIWQGVAPGPEEILRARFFDGGFSKYNSLQFSLRGGNKNVRKFRDMGYAVSYALARGEASVAVGRVEFIAGPYNNRKPNDPLSFGPNGMDYTSMFTAAWSYTIPGGVGMNSFWNFRTAPAQTITVPGFGGPVSGANAYFATDIVGDGGAGSPRANVLPGIGAGQFGRAVKSFEDLNAIIQVFNTTYAGKITPHGQALVAAGLFTEAQLKALGAVTQAIPLVPSTNPNPWHNSFSTDLRVDRPIKFKFREGLQITPFFDAYNLFNRAPAGVYGGQGTTFGSLNYDYARGPAGANATDLDVRRGRIAGTRRVQFGFRFAF